MTKRFVTLLLALFVIWAMVKTVADVYIFGTKKRITLHKIIIKKIKWTEIQYRKFLSDYFF